MATLGTDHWGTVPDRLPEDKILYHYTGPGVGWEFEPDRQYTMMTDGRLKPDGLWLTVDGPDDWINWCAGENFRWPDGFRERHRFEIVEWDRVLMIPDANEVWVLGRKYPLDRPTVLSTKFGYVDWDAVAQDYAGVIIAPYQWSCRNEPETFWYYGWDCAAGYIWDLSVVRHVESEALSDDFLESKVPQWRKDYEREMAEDDG